MKVMRSLVIVSSFVVLLFSMSANASLKEGFLEACDSSPHIDEGSDCMCVFNEVVHQFGEDDAKELIPFVSGDQEMEKEVGDSLNFIAGKCEE